MNRCGILVVILLLTACGGIEPKEPVSAESACSIQVDGRSMFVGGPRCMANLPTSEFVGYWVTDHEYSVFYEDKQDIKKDDDIDAPWLSLSAGAQEFADRLRTLGTHQVFAVRFVGAKSTAPGYYGTGQYKSGMYVSRMLDMREIEFPNE